jgi:hypothetical protein
VFKGSAGASPSRVFAAAIRRLIKRIAWRMQANHEGGLTERARNPSRCRRISAFPCRNHPRDRHSYQRIPVLQAAERRPFMSRQTPRTARQEKTIVRCAIKFNSLDAQRLSGTHTPDFRYRWISVGRN